MELLFLGTGTSTGVPQIGCNCRVCCSDDPKDKRLRASVLITDGDTRILIDCGPDMRQQFLQYNISSVTGILITHEHYDHIGGLDDIRPLGNTDIYAEERVVKTIRLAMPYCFAEIKYPGVPQMELHPISESSISIGNLIVIPIRVMHARLPVLGFRVGKLAYLTDVKSIDDENVGKLKGVELLIINALRPNKHIAHLSLGEALELAARIGAQQTYFTHMSHDMGLHRDVNQLLPENYHLAYDGLVVRI